jgi:hypothetical protein
VLTTAFRLGFRPVVPALLATFCVAACGGHTPVLSADERCHEQITLSLAPGVLRTDRVMNKVSRNSDVDLDYLRSVSTNLHVFMLTADGRDPQCHDALTRLRQNSLVRFAEPDGHRTAFDAVR